LLFIENLYELNSRLIIFIALILIIQANVQVFPLATLWAFGFIEKFIRGKMGFSVMAEERKHGIRHGKSQHIEVR